MHLFHIRSPLLILYIWFSRTLQFGLQSLLLHYKPPVTKLLIILYNYFAYVNSLRNEKFIITNFGLQVQVRGSLGLLLLCFDLFFNFGFFYLIFRYMRFGSYCLHYSGFFYGVLGLHFFLDLLLFMLNKSKLPLFIDRLHNFILLLLY